MTQLSRRALLTGLAATGVLAGCGTARGTQQTATVATAAQTPDPTRHRYGSDPSQFGDLYLPTGTPKAGTVIVIHGGFWRSEYGADLGAPLAAELAGQGWTAWNLEYRRVGNGGGWPQTLADVATGIDTLATLKLAHPGIDLTRVVAIGHSAGGHLAAWAAGRAALPTTAPGAHPKVALTAVVAQAGVLDLTRAAAENVGGTAVPDLLGGLPAKVPARYSDASPQLQLPLRVPVRCVHSRDDGIVPYDQSTGYVAAAKKLGADAELITVPGDHMALIDTESPAWHAVRTLLPALLG